ncbi:hypothetical protein E3P89_03229 [Wallemia ichthyophaga]|uniref:Uncharacterized protein n=1 Tax=Wallemia ichthyophaga TaxID=245174 RepID=A0A4T0HZS3_WALIC|nr:hypothetical protein E3P93_03180 [Wallemia ichthyophaga]TIB09574.1 hypothetical protein E3P90_03211 [Wallemia ichthyophaga]TIB20379.1 hypothetical protein E3P89_03229 [Wallemia ichthyophaga]TIB21989.1 hypothetical protein E3P88_03224 [Wallemia ichthyophaga]TIB60076.1 hypothetical protein E3P78_03286 [Wallemia ichthyophaga]
MPFRKFARALKTRFRSKEGEWEDNERISRPELLHHSNKWLKDLDIVDVSGAATAMSKENGEKGLKRVKNGKWERKGSRSSVSSVNSLGRGGRKIRNSLTLDSPSSPQRMRTKSMFGGGAVRCETDAEAEESHTPSHPLNQTNTSGAHTYSPPPSSDVRSPRKSVPSKTRKRAYTVEENAPPVPPLPADYLCMHPCT